MMQNSNKKSQFITIEGQDGAGKSTNINVIEQCLDDNNIDFISTREPGGTELGELLRDILLNAKQTPISHVAELLMMFAARAQHLEQVILPALQNGQWVLCDRFTDASYAYQSGGRGLPSEMVAQLEALVQVELRPNLTILLDLAVDIGESRVGQRSSPDRFEQQQLDFKNNVRKHYLQRAKSEPNRIKVVNSALSIEQVEQSIKQVLNEFI